MDEELRPSLLLGLVLVLLLCSILHHHGGHGGRNVITINHAALLLQWLRLGWLFQAMHRLSLQARVVIVESMLEHQPRSGVLLMSLGVMHLPCHVKMFYTTQRFTMVQMPL